MQVRVKLVWAKANTSVKWKLQVPHAIIRSKLLHGLECLQLRLADISKLTAFQNIMLSRILHKPPTFVDRSKTNERIYREIREQPRCHFERFGGETWKKNKMKLFGNGVRSPPTVPMHQVTPDRDGLHPRNVYARRTGNPHPCKFPQVQTGVHYSWRTHRSICGMLRKLQTHLTHQGGICSVVIFMVVATSPKVLTEIDLQPLGVCFLEDMGHWPHLLSSWLPTESHLQRLSNCNTARWTWDTACGSKQPRPWKEDHGCYAAGPWQSCWRRSSTNTSNLSLRPIQC